MEISKKDGSKNLEAGFLLVGSLLVGFSSGAWLVPLAAWIGPALIMRYTRNYQRKSGYLLLAAAYIAAFLIGFGAMWLAAWGAGMMIGLGLLYGFLWTLPYLADRHLSPRLKGFSSTLAYPLAAVTLEIINNLTNPVGSWGATGYTQYGNLPLMQLASVTGMIGITFLMGWFASVANWAWENRKESAQTLKGLAAFVAVMLAVFIFGYLRLNLFPLKAHKQNVQVAGLIAVTIEDMERVDKENLSKFVRENFFSATRQAAEAGADVIFWNEASAYGLVSDEPIIIQEAQDIAEEYGIYLVVPLGIELVNEDYQMENKVVMIDPTGTVVMKHNKYGGGLFEYYRRPGEKVLEAVETPLGILSSIICWDADYPDVVRQAGEKGVGLMMVPSGDWNEIDPVHTHMIVFRAIENGTSVVRLTYGGLSIAVDAYGQVLSQMDFYSTSDYTMLAHVPVEHVNTLYTFIGPWVQWLCAAGFIFLIGLAIFNRQKSK